MASGIPKDNIRLSPIALAHLSVLVDEREACLQGAKRAEAHYDKAKNTVSEEILWRTVAEKRKAAGEITFKIISKYGLPCAFLRPGDVGRLIRTSKPHARPVPRG